MLPQPESTVDLFEKEREDLLKELRDLPRNAAMRKVKSGASMRLRPIAFFEALL